MNPSLTTRSAGGAVPILVPPERSLNVWYAFVPLSGTSQPTIGKPSSPPPALSITVLSGPAGLGASGAGAATTGIGAGSGTSFLLNTLTPIRISTSSDTSTITRISHGNPPFVGGSQIGTIVSGYGSISFWSILRTRSWSLPSHVNPTAIFGS